MSPDNPFSTEQMLVKYLCCEKLLLKEAGAKKWGIAPINLIQCFWSSELVCGRNMEESVAIKAKDATDHHKESIMVGVQGPE